jgi:hypothetical protein
MQRRKFVKSIGYAAAGAFAAPYILPSGRLFAASGMRKVDHVVFCLHAGGVRALDTIQKSEGNLVPAMLSGTEAITPDIAASIAAMPPSPFGPALQTRGTLFRKFTYRQGPTGHYNGHTVAITGKYVDADLNIRVRPTLPTVFELYRKHNSPAQTALKSWWVSNSLGPYPALNYSSYPGYGAMYGANFIAPTFLFSEAGYATVGNLRTFNSTEQTTIDKLHTFLDHNFSHNFVSGDAGVTNTLADNADLQTWMTNLLNQSHAGQTQNPWGIGAGLMTNDLYNIYFAEEVIKKYQPELLVVNMQNVDVCHFDFTQYCDNLHRADYAVAHLWKTIQDTPGMTNNTVMIVVPEHGRDFNGNSNIDGNGRRALDHTAPPEGTSGDQMARDIFCLVLGPSSVVKQNISFDGMNGNLFGGESVEVVPTIANLLGFDSSVPADLLSKPFVDCDMSQAFI